jgi:hypothetical protein
MSEWSLSQLLTSLHEDIQQRLATVRKTFNHPGTKGDASENVWISLLDTYLPKRYQAAKAHVVDSLGNFSQQIDVVVFDRQYSPFIFTYENETIIPAESVYAVFEAKQTADASLVAYAQEKVASVRRLHRTSLPIPYAKGVYPAKPLIPILGGLLTFESEWSPALGPSFEKALAAEVGDGHWLRRIARPFLLRSNRRPLHFRQREQACDGVPVQADLTASVQRDRTDDRCRSLWPMAHEVARQREQARVL